MRILTGDTAVRSQIKPLDTAIPGNQRRYRARALWSEAVGHSQLAVDPEKQAGRSEDRPLIAAFRTDLLGRVNAMLKAN
jgi:hypothetical protein